MRLMISGGVSLGAYNPYQVVALYPCKPDS
jgi:hypothetical protein